MNAKSKRKIKLAERDTLRAEYRREDLGTGVRGKYAEQFKESSNLVLLAPDVAEAFPTPRAVNDALRALIDVAQRSAHPRRSRKTG